MKTAFSGLIASTLLVASLTASAAEEVNVYSYRQPFLIKPMFDAFTKESGIKVNTVFAKKGIVERLKNEGANSPADLVFTVDIGRLDAVLSADLTQPVNSDVLNEKIPAEFKGEVSSYEDLASPALKGRVCTRSGKHGYMLALIASVIANSDEDSARTWLQGVKDNLARKPQGNDRAQVKAIKEGECDVAVINSYYMGKMMTNEEQAPWADAVNIIFPNQGDRGTHMNISGMSLTAAAPNKDNAVKLMEYLASDKAQRMYAEQNHEYPVNPKVSWSALVESWGGFKPDNTALAEIAKHRTTAAKMVDQIGYDF